MSYFDLASEIRTGCAGMYTEKTVEPSCELPKKFAAVALMEHCGVSDEDARRVAEAAFTGLSCQNGVAGLDAAQCFSLVDCRGLFGSSKTPDLTFLVQQALWGDYCPLIDPCRRWRAAVEDKVFGCTGNAPGASAVADAFAAQHACNPGRLADYRRCVGQMTCAADSDTSQWLSRFASVVAADPSCSGFGATGAGQ
jgi:hypothetical protein